MCPALVRQMSRRVGHRFRPPGRRPATLVPTATVCLSRRPFLNRGIRRTTSLGCAPWTTRQRQRRLAPGNQRFGMGRAHCLARDASGQDIPRADRQGRRRSLDAIAIRGVRDEGGGNAATCSCERLSGSSVGPWDATPLFPRSPLRNPKRGPNRLCSHCAGGLSRSTRSSRLCSSVADKLSSSAIRASGL